MTAFFHPVYCSGIVKDGLYVSHFYFIMEKYILLVMVLSYMQTDHNTALHSKYLLLKCVSVCEFNILLQVATVTALHTS